MGWLSVSSFFYGNQKTKEIVQPDTIEEPQREAYTEDLTLDEQELEELIHQSLETLTEAQIKASQYVLGLEIGAKFVTPYHAASALYEACTQEFIDFIRICNNTILALSCDRQARILTKVVYKTDLDRMTKPTIARLF